MSTRARKAALSGAMGAVLVMVGAAADDAEERAFSNELRILPAFTAQIEHTATGAEESTRDTARLEMSPDHASFRLRYETLPIEIWRVGTILMTVPAGVDKPPKARMERAGKLAALLLMLGSGAVTQQMKVMLEPHESHVEYLLSPRDEGNAIEWIRYEFDDVGLRRAFVLERSGERHLIVLTGRKPYEENEFEAEAEAEEAPEVATVVT